MIPCFECDYIPIHENRILCNVTTQHLKYKHNMSMQEYLEKYNIDITYNFDNIKIYVKHDWKKNSPEPKKKKTHNKNRSKTPYMKLRWMVLNRDSFTCQYCGKTPQDGVKLHVDHILANAHHGKYLIDNLITSCNDCNYGKGDVLLDANNIKRIKELIKI